jgi:hypothetical protein
MVTPMKALLEGKRYNTALFVMAKLWKQPRCPTTDEWIKKMWHIYIHYTHTMEFYSAIRKNENM